MGCRFNTPAPRPVRLETIFQGNNPDTIPYLRAGYDVQWIGYEAPDRSDDARVADSQMLQSGLTFLRENPGLIPELLWLKFAVHWSIDISPYRNPVDGELPRLNYDGSALQSEQGEALELGGLPPGDPVGAYSGSLFDQIGRPIHVLYFGSLLVLALIGFVASFHLWREVSLLWFLQLVMTALYMVFHSSTRYRVPTDPALFLFSGAALVWLVNRMRARRAHEDSPLLAVPAETGASDSGETPA